MEENVALDSKKQKQFVKSIKGIKKLIVKNKGKTDISDVIAKPETKDEKVKKVRRKRGLVYLAHIPHGFYENEMTQYFKQFGVVTNARVIRSKKTGNSKGFAFVEFRDIAVAEIVAETMNNYLMGKRLIKAVYIPPEKQRYKALRKRWNSVHNPASQLRLKMKREYNANKDDAAELKRCKKMLANVNKTKKRLSDLGISYDFFTPVDIPQALLDSIEVKKEEAVEAKEDKDLKLKKNKKAKLPETAKKTDGKAKTAAKVTEVKVPEIKKVKKEKVKVEINKKEQKQKQKSLKQTGVTPPENFIKIQEDEDSDSSYDFDSDEYEKVLEADDSDLSDESGDEGESDGDDDDDDGDDDDESEEELPPKKVNKKPANVPAPPSKTKPQKPVVNKPVEPTKRKAPQRAPVVQKKPKFEKQKSQKTVKKQFKKKK